MEWTKDNNDKRISKEIKNKVYGNKDRMIRFHILYQEKYDIISDIAYNKMTDKEYEKYIDQSDGGLSDVLANVMGMGEKTYNSVIKKHSNFKGIKNIENFGYSFHIIEKMT